MAGNTSQTSVGKLLPNWAIRLTDRVMDFYINRYLTCDPVILDRPPAPIDGHKYLMYMRRFVKPCARIAHSTGFCLKNTRRARIS